MCLAMYLFTNCSLPESEWIEEDPKMWLQRVKIKEDMSALHWEHRQSHVYYVGGYQGCGCGWKAISYFDEPEDAERKQKDRNSSASLISGLELESSWLVVCWEGDQGKPLQGDRVISMENLTDGEFEFEELHRYRVA